MSAAHKLVVISGRIEPSFLSTDTGECFCWPTLDEPNEELFPYPWSPDDEFAILGDDDTVAISPGFYTGPPPSTPEYLAPENHPANILVQRIIASADKLFFISHPIGSGDIPEWCLVRVAFKDTVSLYSSCVVDVRYLVDFYLLC